MEILPQIRSFFPCCEQEKADLALFFALAKSEEQARSLLFRQQAAAHLVSSGLILSPDREKVLLIYHRLFGAWSFPGGHCDGQDDLTAVALREAREETGLLVQLLCPQMASFDVLAVSGHRKNGRYVSAHLHLSCAYLLTAPEDLPLCPNPDETAGAKWFSADNLKTVAEPHMLPIYQKLIRRAKEWYDAR